MSAYSFINVQATLIGPGGNLQLGSGSGAAEEGITVEMVEEKGDTKVGADGQLMQSLRAGQLGRVTVRLLKTSPVNALLSNMYNFQKSASSLWGNNVFVVSDTMRGDVASCTQCAFTKPPTLVYAKDGNTNEWIFQGNVEYDLGDGGPTFSS